MDADDLQAELVKRIEALAINPASARFAIAVSGGPDSMALLDIAICAFPGRVEAATVDHGLRPASAGEAKMVARWCRGRVPHVVLHPVAPVAGNVQNWARNQRYALLNGWMRERRLDWLLTAHHADDQLETVLMRLNRGAGVSGLAGVRARQGHILRPLLGVRKAELVAYAEERSLPFAHDPSNSDPRFDRAVMRGALAGADWLDPLAAGRSAAALAEVDEAMAWAVNGLAAAHVHARDGQVTLDRTDLPRELLRRLLLRMIAQVEPEADPPRADTIDRAIAVASAGGQMSVGQSLLRGGAIWTVSRAPPRN